MPTDTERLDWLEKQFGCGLIEDDEGEWIFEGDGFQMIRSTMDPDDAFWESCFSVHRDGFGRFRKTAREAIDAAMEVERSES